jgi:hypothetical protein
VSLPPIPQWRAAPPTSQLPRSAAAPAVVRVGVVALVLVAAGCSLPEMAVVPGVDGHGGAGGGGGEASSTGTAAASGGAGGTGGEAGGASPWPDYCTACALAGESMIALGVINEASGIAGSAETDGVFFINNDSGDLPRFFAVADDGAHDGIFSMEPASSRDYEDMAIGPCAGDSCLFVADIGDNDEERGDCAIYRVAEPQPSPGGEESVSPVRLPFVYEDGPHNAETLLVHPLTGEIAIVTKVTSGASGIFRAPDAWAPNATATLTLVGSIAPPEGSPRFTGGSVHPGGAGVLLRTYTHLFFYPAASSDAPLAATLAQAPCAVPVAVEAQGEAVAWTRDGMGYVTVSEGNPTALHHATCEMP